ncbi:MAG: DUF4184 family protein [Deltaproteobacteria bacterium]|nr:DUF4184 family protein [Deltaproteobacteria bacterium]
MPFTAAHVVAVLPAMRWHRALRLDPTCLAIGAMAPDFEYFFRGELVGTIGHTFLGILVWGVPVTLALAAAYHHVVKWPVLLALPRRLAPVFAAPWVLSWKSVVSAALGDLTHLLWDGATHAKGIITRHVPPLTVAYDVPVLGRMVLHRILQHASTAVGLAILAWVFVRAVRRHAAPPVDDVPRLRVRIALAACVAAGVAAMALRLRAMNIDDPGSYIAGMISGVLAGAIVASLIARADGRRFRARLLPETATAA